MKELSAFSACPGFNALRLSRRHALKVGGLGLLGLTMPKLLRAADLEGRVPRVPLPSGAARPSIKPRAKSVIFLFQYGGPSHVDMFDMKPNAPEGIRGPYKPISSKADGIQVCEKLPRTAKIMDKVTLIRSMTHTMKNHNSAGYYALTGHAPPSDDQRLRDSLDLFPGYGSVVDYVLSRKREGAPQIPDQSGSRESGARGTRPSNGAMPDMPSYVSYPYVIRDGSITPGQHASFLGKEHDPLFFTQDPNAPDFALPELSLPANLSYERLESRRELQKIVDAQSRLLDYSAAAKGLDSYYEKALGMLNSTRLRNAFNLSEEPAKVREAYGRTTYGQSCLLARRLVEAGTKFVTVYFSDTIGGQSTTSGGWDTHGFNNTRMFPIIEKYHLPIHEQTLPTLLTDLDERGLLDDTLVVWMGEFGRTPRINENVSRDHWPQCYTTLLAGGGVKRGFVYGESDRKGEYPAKDPVRPDDLAATIYHLLGIDPHTEIFNAVNRPVLISDGQPVMGVMA